MQFFIFDFCLATPSLLAADRQDENQQKEDKDSKGQNQDQKQRDDSVAHEQPLLDPLEPALLEDFMELLSGRTTLGLGEDTDSAAAAANASSSNNISSGGVSDSDEDSVATVGLDVVPSLAARVSLLRQLLTRRDGRTPQLATQLLASKLGATLASAPGSDEAGLLDSQLAVCYMSLQEELLAEGALRSFDASTARYLDFNLDLALARMPVDQLIRAAKGTPAADVLRVLQQVALVR
jgi:hypothetical protein